MEPTPGPELSVAALVEEAAARTGSGSGDVPFTDTLALLTGSCQRSGGLSAAGWQVLRKAALRHLRNLLYVQSYVEANPDAADRRLDSPIVVTGLPRTGTTLLHNLVALDPAHRALRFWEALHPVPPGAGGPSAESLLAQAKAWLETFYRMAPEFRSIHAATADGPEECDALLQNTFASQHFDDMFDAEDYSAWLATAPLADEYRHYALQLRVLSSPVPSGTTWALKSPSHLGHLDALLSALPGCTVVVCHRHPREAVASYASLILAVRRPYNEDVSPDVVGRQALERATTAMGRALEVRDSVPSAFVDVSYQELADDPLGTARDLYEQLGRPLEIGAEKGMRQWVADNPRHRHGSHRYDLAQFGLTEDRVDAAFGPYLARFGPLVA